MIEIKSLTKCVKKKNIIDDISFNVKSGEIFALLGRNGAGKSTTIKTILGFVRPTSGTVSISKSSIGYLPENPYYYDFLTLYELLSFSLSAAKISKNKDQKIKALADKVGMSKELNKQLRKFSKGMIQRSGIAAALIHEPELIILDEPMSGLDPLGRKMVFDLVMELRGKGSTILFCSHILTDVERLCDTAVIMDKGRIVKTVSKEELNLASKVVEIIYEAKSGVIELLKSVNFKQENSFVSVFVKVDKLSSFLTDLSNKGVEPVTIKPSASALETIFTDLVHGE